MTGKYVNHVRRLARSHAEGVQPLVTVYAIPDPQEQEVRLIEVSDAFPHARRPAPVTIGPTHDFPYTSGTISITNAQWNAVLSGDASRIDFTLELPDGWDIHQCQKVWPE